MIRVVLKKANCLVAVIVQDASDRASFMAMVNARVALDIG